MNREKAKEIFSNLFANVDGRSLSLKGREEQQFASKSFVYGEVLIDSFYDLLSEVKPRPGQTFYDLGSGAGKGVMIAHLLFPFQEAKGIELVKNLYNAAAGVKEKYEHEFRPQLMHDPDINGRNISFQLGSFLDYDVSDADVIWMNSTCFQDDLMEALEYKLECVQPHTHIISLSRPFKSPAYHQYKHKMFEFSWGQATAFYHRKRLWKVYM